jgi:hypothetical protein
MSHRSDHIHAEEFSMTCRGAAVAFVNSFGGPKAWDALRPEAQAVLVRWMPKAPLDFAALFAEPTSAGAYDPRLSILVLSGAHAPAPARIIADALPSLWPEAARQIIAGAGHMGPITHVAAVNAAITGV